MAEPFRVSTQGVSVDLSQANGDFTSIDRGSMDQNQLMELLKEVQSLPDPDYDSGEDLCPPSVYVEGPAGQVDFYLNTGSLYEVETNAEVTPLDAVMMAAGHKTVEAPPKDENAVPEKQHKTHAGFESVSQQAQAVSSPGMVRKTIAFIVAAAVASVMILIIIAMVNDGGDYGPGILSIITIFLTRGVYRKVRGPIVMGARGLKGDVDPTAVGLAMGHYTASQHDMGAESGGTGSGNGWSSGGDDGGGGFD